MDFDILKVKFTHYNTVRVGRPFTIYEIEVRSSSTITWVIYKRYSDFYELHQALTHMQQKEGQLKEVLLPHLPPKRLTRSLAAEFVEKRKSELQEYVRDIIKTPALIQSDVVIKFLDVPHSVRPMLFAIGSKKDFPETKELPSDVSSKISMASKTPEERRILELLALLKGVNRVSAVKNFEEYFFENRPRFPGEVIKLLFQGKSEGSDDKEPGLVQTCGDFGSSQVAARAALYLLCRLLDVEKNKDAQLFLDQFTALDPTVLKKMQLHTHIVNERGNRLGAFRIVSVLRNSAANKVADLVVEQVVTDQWARTQYYQWAERKTDQVAPYVSEPQNPVLKSLSLSDLGHKSIASQSCRDILAAVASEGGFRRVVQVGGDGPPGSDDDGMVILYKKDMAQDIVTLKIVTVLPYPVEQIAALCADLKRRREWDLKFHAGKRLAKLDATSDVVHLVFKSFSSPYKYRDFCLLRSMSKIEGKEGAGMVLAARSCLHPLGAEVKDNVRAVLFPTGYVLTPIELKDDMKREMERKEERKEGAAATATATASGAPAKVAAPTAAAAATATAATGASAAAGAGAGAGAGATATGAGAGAGAGATATAAAGAGTRKTAPPPQLTLFTFVAQMDRESVLIVSPDLLGETSELRDSIRNMEMVLARDYEQEYGVAPPVVPRSARPKFAAPTPTFLSSSSSSTSGPPTPSFSSHPGSPSRAFPGGAASPSTPVRVTGFAGGRAATADEPPSTSEEEDFSRMLVAGARPTVATSRPTVSTGGASSSSSSSSTPRAAGAPSAPSATGGAGAGAGASAGASGAAAAAAARSSGTIPAAPQTPRSAAAAAAAAAAPGARLGAIPEKR